MASLFLLLLIVSPRTPPYRSITAREVAFTACDNDTDKSIERGQRRPGKEVLRICRVVREQSFTLEATALDPSLCYGYRHRRHIPLAQDLPAVDVLVGICRNDCSAGVCNQFSGL